jgi:hypothetical protein
MLSMLLKDDTHYPKQKGEITFAEGGKKGRLWTPFQ